MTVLELTAAAYIVMHAAAYDRQTVELARATMAAHGVPSR